MVFQGRVRSVTAMLEAVRTAPDVVPGRGVGLRATAADNARDCRDLLADGESLDACWRFGILQTLDNYTSARRRGGVELAASVFAQEPEATGAVEVDAAFAALAEHLAERDGWTAPAWTSQPSRHTAPWYPSVPVNWRADADRETPPAFRRHGIFLTDRSLARA